MNQRSVRLMALVLLCMALIPTPSVGSTGGAVPRGQGPQLWCISYATAALQYDGAALWDAVPVEMRAKVGLAGKSKERLVSEVRQHQTRTPPMSDMWVGQVYLPPGMDMNTARSAAVCMLYQYAVAKDAPEIWRAHGLNVERWWWFERRGTDWVVSDFFSPEAWQSRASQMHKADTSVLHLQLKGKQVAITEATNMPNVILKDDVAKTQQQAPSPAQTADPRRPWLLWSVLLVVAGLIVAIAAIRTRRPAARIG